MSRRSSSRRLVAAKKTAKKTAVRDKHVGVKKVHVRTVNAPKAW